MGFAACAVRITCHHHLCYTCFVAPFYTDTDPKMEALQVELLRSATSWQKMAMLSALNASARRLAMVGLRQRFPNASEGELRRRLADLLLGSTLAQKVYGELDDDA